jgi:hypothetical protein
MTTTTADLAAIAAIEEPLFRRRTAGDARALPEEADG